MNTSAVELPPYPVRALRSAVEEETEKNRIPVIEAPPGSGKSTLVPFFLLDASWRQGRTILLLQPRRPAVRALAARLRELGGGTVAVGHVTRYEHSVPAKPDIIVMTEGIFTRRLLEDPAAADTAAVILDEFHERSLATDLAYVLARQCRELFRPDLRLLVMSATLERDLFADEPFSLLRTEGTLHPLTIDYRPPPARSRIEEHAAQVCRQWTERAEGSILLFLPGEAEIRRAAEALSAAPLPENVDLYPLYGRLAPREQARAIAASPQGRRKIVIATNIAETSLTIEGISCVVDSGLRRRSSWDLDTGLSRLETVRISAASAEQRAGRAGRLGPGRTIRLWERHERLQDFDPPEIRQADLSGLFLTLAIWGDSDGSSCPWPDPPEEERKEEALLLLRGLGALDEKLVPTEKGAAMARMPVTPRLASMLAEAGLAEAGAAAHTASITAAILEHGDPLRPELRERYGADLELRVELMEQAARKKRIPEELSKNAADRILHEARRLERLAAEASSVSSVSSVSSDARPEESGGGPASPHSPGALLLSAYPDRIARRTEGDRYRLASGPEAHLIKGERGFTPEWIVAGALHRRRREGLIYLAAPLSGDELQAAIDALAHEEERLSLEDNGELRARRLRFIGALRISSTPLSPSDLAAPQEACLRIIREEGIWALQWSRKAEELRRRIDFLRKVQGEPWPEVTEEALLKRLEEWMLPFLPQPLKQDSLKALDLNAALRSLLPWKLQHTLDELAPEQLSLPSGSRRRLRYEGGRCILSARIQQLFGLTDTPKVAGETVEIELLSPAGRAVQVTRDLRSFWEHTYPEVRRELRGRYPKHPWPEDPLTAAATDRAQPKRSGRGE